ncbi:unnamed protein product, partial [Coregonus sp. 'balchen']
MVDDHPNRKVDYLRTGIGCCVLRHTTAGQLWNIIAPRELIDFSYTTDLQGWCIVLCVDHEKEHQSYVRGFNLPAHTRQHHHLSPEPPDGVHPDRPPWDDPQSAVNMAMAGTLINFYTDLRNALKKA